MDPNSTAGALPEWRYAYGGPVTCGAARLVPEDFVVDEELGFAASGAGEHVLVQVEKRDCNTHWVAGSLARLAGVPLRDVGYAGLKDRYAVTRQWFSIGLAGRPEPDWRGLEESGVKVLVAQRHHRKLRRGAHAGNRFRLRVHRVEGDAQRLAEQLRQLAEGGMPNFFGTQRFGHGGGNLAGAAALFAAPRRRVDRQRRGLFLSAARAFLFNKVLDARIADGSWASAVPGDALVLDGRRSFFVADAPDALMVERVAALDLHPSGPLWGLGERAVRAAARDLEDRALEADAAWCRGLEALRVDAARRPLRVRVADLEWRLDDGRCELDFRLPAGSFATVLLRELFAPAAV